MAARSLIISILLCFILFALTASAGAQDAKPITTSDPSVPVAHLELLLIPLPAEQLQIEASGWQQLLQRTVTDISQRETAILQMTEGEEKETALQQLEELWKQRTAEIERFSVVLDHVTEKVGMTENSKEPDLVLSYRRYIDSVDGIRTNVVDSKTLFSALFDWLVSPEGGLRILKHLALLFGITIAFWLLGLLLARGVVKALRISGKSSQMMRLFLFRNIPKAMIIFGFLFGLAVMGVNITPLLAVIGGASFVIAFALQDTLSNFASGVMIMFYRPFDIDDYVNVAGIEGTVKSMTLVSTTISTIDNKMIVVPNNSIWGDVITNVTGVTQRRVDLVFGIGYADDMAKAEKILWEVVKAHPAVLPEPEPMIKVHELAESSVNFICRPWVNTEDYWPVYWDMTRKVKERFDEEGVSIPFPQRDVHIYREDTTP